QLVESMRTEAGFTCEYVSLNDLTRNGTSMTDCDSERDLEPQVQTVESLVAVGDTAVIRHPAADGVAEVRRQPEIGTGPACIGDHAGHCQTSRHPCQAGSHFARVGAVIMIPCHVDVGVQRARPDAPVSLELPTKRAHQCAALLMIEPHGRAVVARLGVAVHADALPLDARKRTGAHAVGPEPPAAVDTGQQLVAVGLTRLGAL